MCSVTGVIKIWWILVSTFIIVIIIILLSVNHLSFPTVKNEHIGSIDELYRRVEPRNFWYEQIEPLILMLYDMIWEAPIHVISFTYIYIYLFIIYRSWFWYLYLGSTNDWPMFTAVIFSSVTMIIFMDFTVCVYFSSYILLFYVFYDAAL